MTVGDLVKHDRGVFKSGLIIEDQDMMDGWSWPLKYSKAFRVLSDNLECTLWYMMDELELLYEMESKENK